MTKTIVGIDVGGTFTDIAVLEDGRLRVHKLPSTPDDPTRSILQRVAETGVGVGEAGFVHGSTVATNALLEGKGGRSPSSSPWVLKTCWKSPARPAPSFTT